MLLIHREGEGLMLARNGTECNTVQGLVGLPRFQIIPSHILQKEVLIKSKKVCVIFAKLLSEVVLLQLLYTAISHSSMRK